MTAEHAVAASQRTRTDTMTMAALVGLAFAVRYAWGIAADVRAGNAGFDDSAWYWTTALNVMHGYGYVGFDGQPTAAWPPGYPMLLGLAYRLLGPTTQTAVLINAIAGGLTCGIVWELGRVLVGPRAAVPAALLFTFFPSQVFFAALTLSESVFTFVATALLLAGVRLLARDAGLLAWLGWGVGVGIVTLVRSETITWFVLPPLALLRWHRVGRAVLVLIVAFLGTMLALTPWIVRNARVYGAFVPTNVGLGRTLWAGHNPNATGGMTGEDQRGIAAVMQAKGLSLWGPANELAANRVLVAEAVAFAKSDPLRELRLIPKRFYHLFRGDHVWEVWYGAGKPRVLPSTDDRRRLRRFGNGYYFAVGILALIGWWLRGWPTRPEWRLFDGLVLLCIATFSLTLGDPRYHQVLIPPACVMAALTVLRLTGRGDARTVDAVRSA